MVHITLTPSVLDSLPLNKRSIEGPVPLEILPEDKPLTSSGSRFQHTLICLQGLTRPDKTILISHSLGWEAELLHMHMINLLDPNLESIHPNP